MIIKGYGSKLQFIGYLYMVGETVAIILVTTNPCLNESQTVASVPKRLIMYTHHHEYII